jgi:hypothetical protein
VFYYAPQSRYNIQFQRLRHHETVSANKKNRSVLTFQFVATIAHQFDIGFQHDILAKNYKEEDQHYFSPFFLIT